MKPGRSPVTDPLPRDAPHRNFLIKTPHFVARGRLVKVDGTWVVGWLERLQSFEGLTAHEIKAKCDERGWIIKSEQKAGE